MAPKPMCDGRHIEQLEHRVEELAALVNLLHEAVPIHGDAIVELMRHARVAEARWLLVAMEAMRLDYDARTLREELDDFQPLLEQNLREMGGMRLARYMAIEEFREYMALPNERHEARKRAWRVLHGFFFPDLPVPSMPEGWTVHSCRHVPRFAESDDAAGANSTRNPGLEITELTI